jgi:hypothetical protein
MGFVGKEGLQTSGTTYRVAQPHMSPTSLVMSRLSFQATTYLISGSRPKPLKIGFVQKKPPSRYALKPE